MTVHPLPVRASNLVGLLLVAVAIVLARESKSLLMGEGVDAETTKRLLSPTEADPAVLKAVRVSTTYLVPEEITLVQEVAFRHELITNDINKAIVRIHQSIY